jgi:RHS repeat-associated protein
MVGTGNLANVVHKIFPDNNPMEGIYARSVGDKRYELKDHLGNVTVVISDVKGAKLTGLVVTNYADKKNYYNYYPFGMLMPNRNKLGGDVANGGYRYGFNGKEKDDELKGSGNSYDFGDRIYDPRLGRWLAVDGRQELYVPIAPYAFAINNPIIFIDKDGNVIYDSEGNEVRIVFEAGAIKEITGTTDARLIELLKNTYAHSGVGKTAVEKMNSEKVIYRIAVGAKRAIFKYEDGAYGEVGGTSGPTRDRTEIHIDIFGYDAEKFGDISASDLPNLSITDESNKSIELTELTDQEKQKVIDDVNKLRAEESDKDHQGSLLELTPEEIKNWKDAEAAEEGNNSLRHSNTLIYEYHNSSKRRQSANVESRKATKAGEAEGKRALGNAHKERTNKTGQ